MEIIKVVRVRNERGQVDRTPEDGFVSYQLCNLVLPGQLACASNDYILSDGERLFSHSFILDSYRKIMGRTLTIIDASIVDKQHNKAVKDLLRQVFNDELSFSSDWAYDQEVMAKIVEEQMPENINDIGTVTIEEALGVK